ncbi:MAG TPA: hypothetical protein VJ698_23125 [Noviherbaspirillum sp.]|uniref:hypothetical protein n=1 Tax=Noviherbaspirillum sp. TaxID=1926288 RepID=UPI002B48CD89|nr:hypothetical protein [Noviherbaspirillum sp.]HJV88380.1 hypothetical protein [Noviherbaspirillum sp.]
MSHEQKSCMVASPRERNHATQAFDATCYATAHAQTPRKHLSIRELRAQLVAQQHCNQAGLVRVTGAQIVADDQNEHEKAALITEFMTVDGMGIAEATLLAATSVPRRPTEEWLAMIKELDVLIGEFCTRSGFSEAQYERIMNQRYKQSLLSIPTTLVWFRREVTAMHKTSNDCTGDS